MGIAVFNLALFLARYPEFSAVNPAKLGAYFVEAGLYLSNTPTSPVCDLTRRLILLNMLVAHIGYLNGDLEATSIVPIAPTSTLLVNSSVPGPFVVAHGLPVAPNSIEILMTSSGAIWQTSAPDVTNLYLSASDANVTATISVFQTTQLASNSGQVRPVGRVSQASEGSVSASFDYGTPTQGSGEWFQQSQYGAAFWQATTGLRGMRYSPRPTMINEGWPYNRRGWYQ